MFHGVLPLAVMRFTDRVVSRSWRARGGATRRNGDSVVSKREEGILPSTRKGEVCGEASWRYRHKALIRPCTASAVYVHFLLALVQGRHGPPLYPCILLHRVGEVKCVIRGCSAPRGVVTVEAVNFFDAVGVGLLRPG
jgi:hypothetical protein